MNKIIFTIITCLLFSNFIYAKRKAPEKVNPVIYNNIKIIAPLSTDSIGTIIAYDDKTNEKLWIRQIYTIKYIPDLEQDVQWVFINKLEIKDNCLLIYNEKNYVYKLNMESYELTVINGDFVIQSSIKTK